MEECVCQTILGKMFFFSENKVFGPKAITDLNTSLGSYGYKTNLLINIVKMHNSSSSYEHSKLAIKTRQVG